MASSSTRKDTIEVVEPIGMRVLIRKDEDKKITKVGIHLPDKIEIPTLTGRIVSISCQIERDEDYPIKQYDRVLFNPKQGVPVDFEDEAAAASRLALASTTALAHPISRSNACWT